METYKSVNAWFWNEYVWLPANVTWDTFANTGTVNYCQFDDLYYAFPVAVVLLAIRYFLEKFLFTPIGIYLGLKHPVQREPDNQLLEKAFCENGRIGYKQIQGLAKQLDWSERKVERWIRKRIARSKPSTLSKFTESAWRFTFYSFACIYGLYTLWDKPWLMSSSHCFYDFPHQSVTSDVWWYYMFELGFYWSLTFSQFLDTKRKDFMQMFVHHIVTIMLMMFSWTCNLFRIGSLVLVIHDFADVPLEAAKMAKYVENQRVADGCFVVFTLFWIVSRLGLYPYRVLYYTLYKALDIVDMFPAYFIFNVLLSCLQVLHIVWTWMIIKIAIRAVFSQNPGDSANAENRTFHPPDGLFVKDLRSDSEEEGSLESSSESESKENSSQEKKDHAS